MSGFAEEESPYGGVTVPDAPDGDVVTKANPMGMTDIPIASGTPASGGAPPPVVARKIPARIDQGNILQVTVTDPVKQGEGVKAFISYKVNTKTDLPEYDMSSFSVIRRYSDFVWLINQLVRDFPGYVIPPLPGKSVLNKFDAGFIETRRRGLEKCLNRISEHAALRKSDHFKCFLEAKEEGFSIQKVAASEEAKSKSKGFFSWITDTATSTYNNVRGSVKRERTQDDVRFDEITEYIETLEPQLQAVSKNVSAVIQRGIDMGNCMFDVGLAFTLMGQSDSGKRLREGLTKMGHTADSLSVLAKETADKEIEHFDEAIKDYLRMIGSVRLAMAKRNSALNELLLAMSNHSGKVEKHQSLVGQPGKEDLAQKAMDSVVVAQAKEDQAKKKFHTIQQILFQEFDRFRREKTIDFKKIMTDYANIRIAHSRAMEKEWEALLPVLDAIKHEEAGAAVEASSAPVDDGDSI